MLNKKQIEEIEVLYEKNKRMSAKALIEILRKRYCNIKPADESHGNIRSSLRHGVTTIDPEAQTPFNKTRQREVEKGFKVRSEQESSASDRQKGFNV